MDEYKQFYYAAVPSAKNVPYGKWVGFCAIYNKSVPKSQILNAGRQPSVRMSVTIGNYIFLQSYISAYGKDWS